MTAPVPLTLDELLHAVVEACVQEITAAQHELVTERAAHAAELRRKGDPALKVTLPNGIEVQTETSAEAEALMDWLMQAPELVTSAVRAAKRGPYGKHNLGPVQSKIVEALGAGPLQHRELAELTGAADRNLRYTLLSMTARGLVVRGWNQLRQVVVYALPGVELPPVPEDRPNKGVRVNVPPLAPRAPTAERSADAVTRTPSPRSPAVEAGKDAEATPSGGAAKPSAQPTAVGAFNPRQVGSDLTGERLATFVGAEKTRDRRLNGEAVWLFRCELCATEKRWSMRDVRRIRRKHAGFKCRCQKPGGDAPKRPAAIDRTGLVLGAFTCEADGGGEGTAHRWLFRCRTCKGRLVLTASKLHGYQSSKTSPRCTTCEPPRQRGRPPKNAVPAAYTPETDGFRDTEPEDLDELDAGDTDALLSRAMRESEGDGFIRRALARPAARRPERDGEDDQEDGERQPAEDLDEDADDETEELDFE